MTAPTPGSELDPPHRRVALDDWAGVYVVGDVHGCPGAFDRLLAELGVTDDDLVIVVGDLVRKGPDSEGVVDRVRAADNVLSVRGNNEEKLVRGEESLPDLADDDLDWLASLPVAISWEATGEVRAGLVVHGGVDPRITLAEHAVETLQTTRSLVPDGSYGDRPYWWERYEGPRRVFFGHTVLDRPVVREHAVGLDTGCVYGGELTAYDLRRDRFVSVDSDEPARARADAKVLSPPVDDPGAAGPENACGLSRAVTHDDGR
ncbi:metallophosphoesterase family protein [Halorarum halobium]|uniref:metallophosphoesterase family protein n=1 Tax=Halorarum halobium TaxID=3075121 RepID=UPI0028A733BE|nr:metallophosphoesterase family protein [Halobaculum sp. XH14]